MTFVLNVCISAFVISFAAWLSRRAPGLAGFIVAMPVATLLVLPLSYLQHGDADQANALARSILIAIPVTLLFFVPFLVSDRLSLSFWQAYACACAILPLGYLVHRAVTRAL